VSAANVDLGVAETLGCDRDRDAGETAEVRAWLADAGCAWAQGWHVSAAVPGRLLPEVRARLAAEAVSLPVPWAAVV
jgi:sensor c-di-GMP phosphodiesterase-like protein